MSDTTSGFVILLELFYYTTDLYSCSDCDEA